MDPYVYDGQVLGVKEIMQVMTGRLQLSDRMMAGIGHNRQALERLLSTSGQKYYGINTGFGSLYSVAISPNDVQSLQANLLRSHACGVGAAAPQHIVRLTLLLKIISLAQGQSGVRKEVVTFLTEMYNHQIFPVVPMMGSLGASGDLAPLAHLCLPLIGEGEVVYKREQMPAAKALMLAGMEPLSLEAKEGLALINGTQYSLSWLLHAVDHAGRLAHVADMCAAMAMDAFDAHPSPLDEGIHRLRNQPGQIRAAAAVRA